MTIAFQKVQVPRLKRNKFDLTHDVKFSGRMGHLIPSMVMECIPGDKINIGCDALVRFMPLIAPIMHRVNFRTEYFFVPNRLLWENWQDYITQKAVHVLPYVESSVNRSSDQQKFMDYMGIPPAGTSSNAMFPSALPLAAYQFIYNEFYRDQNLISPVNYTLTDGNNSSNGDLMILRKRAWEHDYFTSCLPFAQKGAAIDIPLGTVLLDPAWRLGTVTGQTPSMVNENGAQTTGHLEQVAPAGVHEINVVGSANATAYDPDGSLTVEATTINDLRRAEALQKFFEAMARGGNRFKEWLLNIFGVNEADSRLQRPEFIVGVKEPIIISEVLNTTGETAGLPQGNMAGHAVSIGQGRVGSFYAQEHGYIIGITSVLPRTAYSQGMPKHYLHRDPFDFFTPQLANIGEEAIIKNEIYGYNGGAYPTATFGYLPQYSSYRTIPSRIAGDMRTTLDFWHLGRTFASGPSLNQQFIECDPDDCERIFAVQTGDDNLIIHMVNKITAIRPVPVFGTPQL